MLILWLLGLLLSLAGVGVFILIPVGIWWVIDLFLIPGMADERTDAIRQRIERELAADN